MKTSTKTLSLILSVIMFSASTTVLAAEPNCDIANPVHCVYVTGLAATVTPIQGKTPPGNGRYIKIVMEGDTIGSSTTTQCFNNTSTMAFGPKMAKVFEGKNSFTFSICKHAKGADCKPLGTDAFTVTGTTAEPKYYDLNLSSVQADYPKCDVQEEKINVFEK